MSILQEETSGSDSDSNALLPQVSIKPRPLVHVDNEQDFFLRRPQMSLENWNDSLESWEVRFNDQTLFWTPKEQHKHARQSLKNIAKFRGDKRFPQEVLDQWEAKLESILEQAEKV